MKNKKTLKTTKWICLTALATALVIATGFIPAIPTPLGRIYWVDGMVLTAAFLFDPLAAFIAGGIGSLIYDLLMSPSMMIPSLIIHGLQGAIASAFTYVCISKKHKALSDAAGAVAAALFVILGYFIYRSIMYGPLTAAVNIPRNIIQEAIGIALAIIICYAAGLKKRLAKSRLIEEKKVFEFSALLKKRAKKASCENKENKSETVETVIADEENSVL